jgi:hypothetical protein
MEWIAELIRINCSCNCKYDNYSSKPSKGKADHSISLCRIFRKNDGVAGNASATVAYRRAPYSIFTPRVSALARKSRATRFLVLPSRHPFALRRAQHQNRPGAGPNRASSHQCGIRCFSGTDRGKPSRGPADHIIADNLSAHRPPESGSLSIVIATSGSILRRPILHGLTKSRSGFPRSNATSSPAGSSVRSKTWRKNL